MMFINQVVFFFCAVLSSRSAVFAEVNTTISRDHVAVWFDYSVRFYEYEADNAYTQHDIAIMVELISSRFRQIAIDTAPAIDKLPPSDPNVHSRILVPTVVANYNKAHHDNSISPSTMKVIVTFDVAKVTHTDQVTSFDVAKYMADQANQIYSGTVHTLMMSTGYSSFSAYYNIRDTAQQLKEAREKINGSGAGYPYQLGVSMDLRDCGKFQGSLGEKAKEVLPHVDLIVTLLRPSYHQLALKSDVVQKMYITKFEDCERKLKAERPDVTVVPSVLWASRKESSRNLLQAWEKMGDWAKKHDRYVIMYEAFETPNGHLISDQGWWRLKDKATHVITKDAFVERIQEINSSKSKPKDTISSNEDNSDEEMETTSPSPRSRHEPSRLKSISSSTEYPQSPPNSPLYIAIVLLSVVCTLLGAVIAGLVYGFHTIVLKNNNGFTLSRRSHSHNGHLSNGQHQRLLEGDYGEESINGAVLEIRDTTPIVAVTYRK